MQAAAGAALFSHHCHACHSEDSAKNTFGPSLTGVVGRPAASLPRFVYSDALRASGVVWNEQSLRSWISDNEKFVPGTRMRHVSITDPAEQDYLIAFLKTLR
jgi:cytochrome c